MIRKAMRGEVLAALLRSVQPDWSAKSGRGGGLDAQTLAALQSIHIFKQLIVRYRENPGHQRAHQRSHEFGGARNR
jgi:hypothetical protein